MIAILAVLSVSTPTDLDFRGSRWLNRPSFATGTSGLVLSAQRIAALGDAVGRYFMCFISAICFQST